MVVSSLPPLRTLAAGSPRHARGGSLRVVEDEEGEEDEEDEEDVASSRAAAACGDTTAAAARYVRVGNAPGQHLHVQQVARSFEMTWRVRIGRLHH